MWSLHDEDACSYRRWQEDRKESTWKYRLDVPPNSQSLLWKNCMVIIKRKLYFIVEANLIKWPFSGYLSQMRARDATERLEDIWITKLWRMFVRWASEWLVFARRRTTAVYGANSTQTTAGMCGQRDETLLWKQSGMCRTRKFKLCVFIGRW